jgi:hypothetical protein
MATRVEREQLLTAIFQRLKANTTLQGLLSPSGSDYKIYRSKERPERSTTPCVRFFWDKVEAAGFDNMMENNVVKFIVDSHTQSDAETIIHTIIESLDRVAWQRDYPEIVSDIRIMEFTREGQPLFTFPSLNRDLKNVYEHHFSYRVRLLQLRRPYDATE